MEDHLITLQAIYDITKEDPNPESYKCRPREIILHQSQSWTTIEKQLRSLEAQGMIKVKKEDTIVVSITKEGLRKIRGEKK